ncbi:MAG: pyridoxamine 5'-phosphate oxidase family protein [Clostridia bacterium]|nr:pyridoxamine 5'-phosphate oxidase family protein [Clostridia bacterium]
MSMKEVIEFANSHKTSYLTTTEGSQPRVRGMWMWYADETGFYFHTGTMKRLFKQMVENPNVEICFFDPQAAPAGKMLRVAGKVEFVKDAALEKKLVEERKFLEGVVSASAANMLAIFRIPHGEAYFWTMEVNTRESEVESIKF